MFVRVCECLFWIAALLIVYPYLIFPAIVFMRRLFIYRPFKQSDITPEVSMIIAAYNEADDIEDKLKSVLSLDYPRDRLDVIVASDGSTDGTNEIVRKFEDQRVRLLALPRQGKAAAMNAAVGMSTNEILVFSDANSVLATDAIRRLVRPFADESIGGVAGNQVYYPTGKRNSSLATSGERIHWWLDRKLKVAGSQSGSAISATGSLYAIRRNLFQRVPIGVTDDFVTSSRVVAQGFRLVFEPDAVAYEPVAKSANAEFNRKVRVLTRGFCSVLLMRELLNVFRYGFYSVQLFSQKVMRRLVSIPLLLVLVVNPFLWNAGNVYRAALLFQLAIYGAAALGFLLARISNLKWRVLTVPCYFCLINLATLIAAWNVVRGNRITRWETQRSVSVQPNKTVG